MTLEGAPAGKSTQSFTDAQVVVLRLQGGDFAVPTNRVQETSACLIQSLGISSTESARSRAAARLGLPSVKFTG